MSDEIEIEGLAELQASLGELSVQLADLTTPALAAGQAILDAASPSVPFDTGALAGSGQVITAAGEVDVQWTQPYAGVIFGGWSARNIVAQPWVATPDTVGTVHDTLLEYVQDAVAQVQGA